MANQPPENKADDIQLESPQATIRSEATPAGQRAQRQVTYGELRVMIHAITAVHGIQRAAAERLTAALNLLADKESAARAWLLGLRLTETGAWLREREAYERHHTLATDAGEAADDVVLARRPWLPDGLYYALVAILTGADFLFFLGLWRDVEEAEGWASVQTVQAACYALITPVTTTAVALLLGRQAAEVVDGRKGTTSRGDRVRLLLLCGLGVVAVTVVLAAVWQRVAHLAEVDGGADLKEPLFYLLFLILPLALGVVEVFRNSRAVRLDERRVDGSMGAAEHVGLMLERGRELHGEWARAHRGLGEIWAVLELDLQEPLHAAADLIAQERAHDGSDGEFAATLWSTHSGPAHRPPGDATWVPVDLPHGMLDPVLDGPAPRIKLELVDGVLRALDEADPPSVEIWLRLVEKALRAEGPQPVADAATTWPDGWAEALATPAGGEI